MEQTNVTTQHAKLASGYRRLKPSGVTLSRNQHQIVISRKHHTSVMTAVLRTAPLLKPVVFMGC